MTNEVQTDATKALADVKGVIAGVDADAAKVKVWFKDYRTYIVCGLCFILGFLAHSVHL